MDSAARQSENNQAYVRELLRQRDPGFAAALEAAMVLADTALSQPEVAAG